MGNKKRKNHLACLDEKRAMALFVTPHAALPELMNLS